jgi:hypothetical protein
MLEHWRAGLHDVRHTLAQPAWRDRTKDEENDLSTSDGD